MATFCLVRNNETIGDIWFSFYGFVNHRASTLHVTPTVYGSIDILVLFVSAIINFCAIYSFMIFRRQGNATAVRINLKFAYITSVRKRFFFSKSHFLDFVIFLLVVGGFAYARALACFCKLFKGESHCNENIILLFADHRNHIATILGYAAWHRPFLALNSNEQFLLYAAEPRRARIFAGNSIRFFLQNIRLEIAAHKKRQHNKTAVANIRKRIANCTFTWPNLANCFRPRHFCT